MDKCIAELHLQGRGGERGREGGRRRREEGRKKRKIPSGTGELGKCLGQGCRYPQKEGIRRVVSSLSEAIIKKKYCLCVRGSIVQRSSAQTLERGCLNVNPDSTTVRSWTSNSSSQALVSLSLK